VNDMTTGYIRSPEEPIAVVGSNDNPAGYIYSPEERTAIIAVSPGPVIAGAAAAVRGSKAIIIESPTAAEDLSFFFTSVAFTITEMRAVLVGSSTPSVTWTLRHGADRSAVGSEAVTGGTVTTDTTAGSDVTIFDDADVATNSHLWIETTAKSGIVGSIVITLFYREN